MENSVVLYDNRQKELDKLKKQRNILIASVLIVIISCFAIYFFNKSNNNYKISLDINPSVELITNDSQKVVNTNALNTDGETVLSDMNLIGVDYNVAVNAVLGSMLKNGYIQDNYRMLISVQGENISGAERIRQNILSDTSNFLKNSNLNGSVYNQIYSQTERELLDIAAAHNISYNKARFIKQVVDKDSSLNISDLAKMTIEEIDKLIASKSITTPTIERVDNVSNNAVAENNTTTNSSNNDSTTPQQPSTNSSSNSSSTTPQQPSTNSSSNSSSTTPQQPSTTPQQPSTNSSSNSSSTTPQQPAQTGSDDAQTVSSIRSQINSYTSRYNQLAGKVNYSNAFQYIAQIEALGNEIDYYEDSIKSFLYQGKLTSTTYYSLKAELELLDNKVDRLEDMYDFD